MGKEIKENITTFSLPKVLRRHSIVKFLLQLGIISKEQLVLFNKNSFAYLNLEDPEPRNVFLKSFFDKDFFRIASNFLKQEGVFFDLGANHGLCTFGLLPKYKSAKFHLFEANETLCKTIKRSTLLYSGKSFFINHACISDRTGFSKFHLEHNQTGQSHVATNLEKGLEVKNLILDDYCIQKNISEIDFVKIDLEGHELPALKGWKNSLRNRVLRAIYIEIMPENQRRYNLNTKAPLEYLESFGYELYLCKDEDFGFFGENPKKYEMISKTLILSRFKSTEFPDDFATDVLAIASQKD